MCQRIIRSCLVDGPDNWRALGRGTFVAEGRTYPSSLITSTSLNSLYLCISKVGRFIDFRGPEARPWQVHVQSRMLK